MRGRGGRNFKSSLPDFFFLEALCSDMYCVYWCHVGHLFTLVNHEGAYWYASVNIP